MNTTHFQKWASDKPKILAAICHSFADSASSAHKLLLNVRDDALLQQHFTQPSLQEWLSFYSKHRNILQPVAELLGHSGSFTGTLFDRITAPQSNFNPTTTEDLEIELDKLTRETSGMDYFSCYLGLLEDDVPAADETLVKKCEPAMYFALKVFIPCWLYYGKTPGHLLREARQKNLKSLEQLILLDSSIIFEKKVSKIIHDLRGTNQFQFEKLITAQWRHPRKEYLASKLKGLFAGKIAAFSDFYGRRLTAPEIRELYDAMARDNKEGEIDTQLPESDEAFKKTIQREKKFWEQI
nr:hypothetical protein [uncultured Desulfuromonas sp.]